MVLSRVEIFLGLVSVLLSLPFAPVAKATDSSPNVGRGSGGTYHEQAGFVGAFST
jgi:hypothetical protein